MQDTGAMKGHARTVLRAGSGKVFGGGGTDHVLAAQPTGGNGRPGGVIEVRLRALLAARGMTLAELSHQVGVTVVNLSVLKNGHARAIRFSTLARLCEVLECQPGDLLTWRANVSESAAETEAPGRGAEAR